MHKTFEVWIAWCRGHEDKKRLPNFVLYQCTIALNYTAILNFDTHLLSHPLGYDVVRDDNYCWCSDEPKCIEAVKAKIVIRFRTVTSLAYQKYG